MPDSSSSPRLQPGEASFSADATPGEDYYYEGPYLVFTERYHLKRGYCCHSGCRHCPYKNHAMPSGSSPI